MNGAFENCVPPYYVCMYVHTWYIDLANPVTCKRMYLRTYICTVSYMYVRTYIGYICILTFHTVVHRTIMYVRTYIGYICILTFHTVVHRTIKFIGLQLTLTPETFSMLPMYIYIQTLVKYIRSYHTCSYIHIRTVHIIYVLYVHTYLQEHSFLLIGASIGTDRHHNLQFCKMEYLFHKISIIQNITLC